MSTAPRVVVVDDDEILAGELSAVLEECGFDVVGTASDGRAGIEVIDRTLPDLAIFDVRMPVMTGTEAAAVLYSRHPGLPVVLLSAYDDDGIKAEAGACRVAGYVVKGSGIRELLSVLVPLVGEAL